MTAIIDKTDYRLFYYLSYIIKFRWEELRQKCDNIMTEEYELGSSSYGAQALHTDSLEPTKIENTVSDNLAFGNFQQKNSNWRL